ncbi:hypothetical protein RN001_015461 [Aquatica leii]|uniref:ATP synthase subunit s-like protein n=1 Tax=Aquatica leii TaxID=1421715 RepID=A0AAN7NZ32_9COLE|nr:hypothetical protein RN001_015461 [Aquatica leii]
MIFQKFIHTKSLGHVRKNRALLCKCMSTSIKSENDEKLPTDKPKEIELSKKVEITNLTTKKDLQWRTPWHEKDGQYYSFLRTFYTEESSTTLLKLLQTPVNLHPTAIKQWWARKMERQNMLMQQYIPERNQTLGDELAAAHFIVYRGGAVKFFDDDKWIKANELKQYELPVHYDSEKILQAIDCSGMNLYYEGLANLRNLKKLEWLSLSSCANMDDWAMDTISNIFSDSLIYLDIRYCPRITVRGLGALHTLKELKILYVDEMLSYKSFELTCLMLQDILPNLDIRTA